MFPNRRVSNFWHLILVHDFWIIDRKLEKGTYFRHVYFHQMFIFTRYIRTPVPYYWCRLLLFPNFASENIQSVSGKFIPIEIWFEERQVAPMMHRVMKLAGQVNESQILIKFHKFAAHFLILVAHGILLLLSVITSADGFFARTFIKIIALN